MTKMEIIHYILSYNLDDINSRLDKLMADNRITGGARYYVYNPYDFHSSQMINEICTKAAQAKDYIRYIKRIDSWTYNYYLKKFNEDIAKTLAFIEEQEALPFDQTQKQLLIQSGELKED